MEEQAPGRSNDDYSDDELAAAVALSLAEAAEPEVPASGGVPNTADVAAAAAASAIGRMSAISSTLLVVDSC